MHARWTGRTRASLRSSAARGLGIAAAVVILAAASPRRVAADEADAGSAHDGTPAAATAPTAATPTVPTATVPTSSAPTASAPTASTPTASAPTAGTQDATAPARRAPDGATPRTGATTGSSPDAAGSDAGAAPGGTKPAELEPIVVRGEKTTEAPLVERTFDTPDDATAFGETILAEPLWRGFESTAELLGQSVGAQLRRQGGRDDFATLSIRGAPASQVRILLDGVALGRASDSVVNLADLPMDTVERIEVYRGIAPVGLSPGSAAGVINVITRDPSHPTASAAAGGGSFGTGKANVGGAGPLLGGSASAFASYRHTDGDFDYVDDNGTIFNPDDDAVRKRSNNDSDTVDSLLRWRRDLGDAAQAQLRNQVFWKDEGVAGLARFSPPSARLETTREIAAATLGGRDRRWSVEQDVTWQRQKLTDYGAFDNTGDTTAATTSARWGRPLGKWNWWSGSGEYSYESFDQSSAGASIADQRATRSSLAIATGDDMTLEAIRSTLSFQLRHQQLWNDDKTAIAGSGTDNDHSTDPRVGLRWEPGRGVTVKANASSYFRPPDFDELYGITGFTTGNPDLKPESGIAWDAGLEWTGERQPFGRLSAGYAYFGSNIDDVIVVVLTFDRTAKAVNASKARIRGHEARVEWEGPWGLALSANYTHQDARNDSGTPGLDGKDLPGLPPDEGYLRASWTRGLVTLAYDLTVSGSHYIDSENVQPKLPTRTVHDLSLVLGPFWRGFRVTLEADNLGDSLVPDQIGFPLPGRSFYATLSWSMAPDDAKQP